MINLKRSIFALSVLIALLVGFTACDAKPRKYIKTERGLIRSAAAYCELGMLLNNDRINILDESSTPITCSGYIYLTKEEIKAAMIEIGGIKCEDSNETK